MARPIKKEPDYVPLDTDLLSNRKIRQIKRKYGSDTFLLYIALLCDIYANGYYITAYKEERELAFLRKVFQQYKAGYPLERLYPARVYQSLQERGLIHDTPEEKRHAMSLFAHWRPPGSPAHQRGLSADDGATASHGMVAAEVFRWADS